MTIRENFLNILNFENFNAIPLVHFGFWQETLYKWADEGHISQEEARTWNDGNSADKTIAKKLGFDINYVNHFSPYNSLFPFFETTVLETLPDGKQKMMNKDGVIVITKKDTVSIPYEVDHLLKGRIEWEEHYKFRFDYDDDRIYKAPVYLSSGKTSFTEAQDYLKNNQNRDIPYGIFCGSMIGRIRDILGIEGLSYLYADDYELYTEIIDTVGHLQYTILEKVLSLGCNFDFAHFWEDICFKNGPLVIPSVFDKLTGPHYKKMTDLLKQYGVLIVSVDCDGLIDSLIPTWINNGVNTMFPIEVGTWNASIKSWREKYGRKIRGVGGMNKNVFSRDYKAVDVEIERLKPLIELGGYLPCPDHRIASDAKWENVQYYCEKMRRIFS